MICPRWIVFAGLAMVSGCIASACQAQEQAARASQATPQARESTSEKARKTTYSHANDFLITGTVFDQRGYAFPGVRLKIRRSNEKRFHWDDFTNSRGDFAVRVPKGSQYELVVHAKGFADQARELDAKSGQNEARLVFRMEPGGGEKK